LIKAPITQDKKPRGGKEPITDARIIGELPPGEVHTPEELQKARQYFKNHKQEARN
jgi:choline kinase